MTSQPLTPPAATTRDSAVRPPPAAPRNQFDLSVVTENVTGEVLARLLLEFEQRLRPEFIRELVASCYRDLAGAFAGALPELLERLAWQRVLDALNRQVIA